MTIERTLNGKEMILRPEGRLDAITAPELKQLLGETMDSIDSLTRFHAKTLGDYQGFCMETFDFILIPLNLSKVMNTYTGIGHRLLFFLL